MADTERNKAPVRAKKHVEGMHVGGILVINLLSAFKLQPALQVSCGIEDTITMIRIGLSASLLTLVYKCF